MFILHICKGKNVKVLYINTNVSKITGLDLLGAKNLRKITPGPISYISLDLINHPKIPYNFVVTNEV